MGTARVPGIAVEGDVEEKEEGEAVFMYSAVLGDKGVLERCIGSTIGGIDENGGVKVD